ncbi:MAG: hypothetical protein HYV01_09245 [Deltaproteobacteria bacterium]|nr:hypothetical protein [Deltaproteobacteria bacterium]MBI3063747.1 hypothetical protein [Deltaproteobacteria bacterium]
MKVSASVLAATLLLGSSGLGLAQTTTQLNSEATKMNNLASTQGETKVVDKISTDFNSFLGADSKAVVSGLRSGTPITLTRTTASPGSTPGTTVNTTTTIAPPTGKMGVGNVYISLALAKQQLSQMGITQPTPEQLQAALTGGTISTGTGAAATSTNLQGILTMRSEQMGWGQIAQKLGFKLGPVISGMKNANQSMTTAAAPNRSGAVTASGQSSGSSESGIVNGSGKSNVGNGHANSGKSGSNNGIVSGSGRTVNGSGHASGRGIVTGSGDAAGGASGVVSASSRGNSGQARGHTK